MSQNCCDYGCTASHGCPARPTPAATTATATPAERAVQFQAETDRLQHAEHLIQPDKPWPRASSELPSPLEQIDVFPQPPRVLVALAYGLTGALALVGFFMLLGHAAAKLEKVFA